MATMMSVGFLRNFNALKSTKIVYPHIRLMSAQAQPLEKVKEERSNKEGVAKEKLPETNSFIMSLFSGQAKVNQVFPFPDVLTDDHLETLNLIRESSLKLYNELHDPLVAEENGKADDKTIQMLKDIGSFGLMVPTKYGGAGMNNTQYAVLAELSGQSDLGLAVTLGAHQSIGYKGILLYGNEKQKDKYLPDLAAGRRTACFCLTEPSAGSDAASLRSKAVLSPDGSHYILNGTKIWISNGGLADIFTVFARTPVVTSNGQEKDKVTAFIVEREFGGVTSGPDEKKMGIKTSNTAHVYFENVKIPAENVLGEIGNGFKIAMNVLNSGRFGMGAMLSGTMKLCIAKATDFANNRVQFGDKIASFGTIQEKIARMTLAQYIAESMAYMVAGNMDKGSSEFQLEAAISKVFASEAAWFVCDETIQILGGMGYMRETGIEKIMRDLRIFRIFEGTNDILRLFVALTGVQNAGSHLKELQKAMKNPVANLGMIFDVSTKRVFRAVGLSSGPSLTEFVTPELAPSAALVSKSVTNFGATVEHLLIKYNKKIVDEQFLLNRLANSAIDIYSMMVTLSRATASVKKNSPSAPHEVNMVKVICNEASARVHQNLVACRSNEKLTDLKNLKKISDSIFVNNGVWHRRPVDQD